MEEKPIQSTAKKTTKPTARKTTKSTPKKQGCFMDQETKFNIKIGAIVFVIACAFILYRNSTMVTGTYTYQDVIGHEYCITIKKSGDAFVRMTSGARNELDSYAYADSRKGDSGTWEKHSFRNSYYIRVDIKRESLYIYDGRIYTDYEAMESKYTEASNAITRFDKKNW